MHTTIDTQRGPRAGRREWIGLGLLASACMLAAMDLSVLFLALPTIARDLAPTGTELLWITDIYGFMIAGSLITMGTLGDRIGRRRVLLIGAAAFGAASILAAFSTSPEMLIAARGLLGVAGACLAPSTLSLLTTMFTDPRQRNVAMGIWGSSFAAGAAVGPLLGGLLLHVVWWGSVFLLAVPVMALLLIAGPRVLPEYRNPEAGRLDALSAALATLSVLAIIFGLKDLAKDGPQELSLISIPVGLTLGWLFLRRQRTLAEPLVDLRVFRAPAFSAALVTNSVSALVAFGLSFLTAQYLQLGLGMGPFEAGLWTLPAAAGVVAGGMVLAPVIIERSGTAVCVVTGLLLAAAGASSLTQLEGDTGLALVVVGTCLINTGMGLIFTVTIAVIVASAPAGQVGAASGLSETGTELGGSLGIALLGSLLTAIYRGEVGSDVPGRARDSLAGAVDGASQLSAGALELTRDAFVDGLHVAAALSAVVLVALAVVARLTSRRRLVI